MTQTSAHDNLRTMRRYFDLLFGKEMQPLLDMFADDVNWFIVVTGTKINGKEELKAGAQKSLDRLTGSSEEAGESVRYRRVCMPRIHERWHTDGAGQPRRHSH